MEESESSSYRQSDSQSKVNTELQDLGKNKQTQLKTETPKGKKVNVKMDNLLKSPDKSSKKASKPNRRDEEDDFI